MKSIRALAFKIMDPNPSKQSALNHTTRVFRRAVNFYLHKIGQKPERISNKNMPEAYKEAKNVFPTMNTALLQQAGRLAIEQYRAYANNDSNPHFPHFDSFVPVRYDNRTMTVYGARGGQFDLWVSVATTHRRKAVALNGAKKHIELWKSEGFSFKDARLQRRGDDFYLVVHIETEAKIPSEAEFEHFVGLDLGLNKIATVVVQNRAGEVLESCFFDGGYVAEKQRRFYEKRREYASKGLWEKLKDTKGKQRRFMKDQNHKISRAIVNIARKYSNAVVVMEKLDGIRKNARGTKAHNRNLHSWAFAELQEFIGYKCHLDGIAYRRVPAYWTSSFCTDCGSQIRRRSPVSVAVCESCKKEVNADHLGAVNVVRRLFFYMEDNTEPCESGSSGCKSADRGHSDAEGCFTVRERLLKHQLRRSVPRSLLQTEAVA